jgi:hypothetical protein
MVAELCSHRVHVLRYSNGGHVRNVGSAGSENGQLRAHGVLIDGQGRVVVSVQVLQSAPAHETPLSLCLCSTANSSRALCQNLDQSLGHHIQKLLS